MMDKRGGIEGQAVHPGKYARVERERRFLLAEPPAPSAVTVSRVISDRYVTGTRLRLRRADFSDGRCELKLTQKVPISQPGAIQGLITNTYLSPAEYDVIASLPATLLSKTRFSVPPWVSTSSTATCRAWYSQKPSSLQMTRHSPLFPRPSASQRSPTTPASPEGASSKHPATSCSGG